MVMESDQYDVSAHDMRTQWADTQPQAGKHKYKTGPEQKNKKKKSKPKKVLRHKVNI